jgi:hypothetical protein
MVREQAGTERMTPLASDAIKVLDDLEQELLDTLAQFDDEAVALAVLDALERVRARSQTSIRQYDPVES